MLSGRPDLDPVRLFSSIDFAGRNAVIAAVSGGGDSTALLLLLKSFLSRRHPDVTLVAATVDHGLRPESAAEAAAVATFCGARGIEHRTLRWEGERPMTGLSAAGREARYRLLTDAARHAGADLVFIGHTQDDQVETALMRSARAQGRGVAAIAPATLHRGTWFVRPLLDVSRETLRHYLRDEGVRWIDDPTNENIAYERVRVRRSIAQAGEPERRRLAALAREAADKRERDGAAAARLIEQYATLVAPGLVRLAPEFAGEGEAAVYGLRALLATVGGVEHLPELDRSNALFGKLQPGFRATLSRAVVDVRKTGIYLRREARGLPDVRQVSAGEIWDGRFQVGQAAGDVTVAAFGADQAKQAKLPESGTPESLVRAALACLPVVPGEAGEAQSEPLATSGGDETFIPVAGPWARFLPSFDLAPACAVASLVGAKPFPGPPFASHIAGKA